MIQSILLTGKGASLPVWRLRAFQSIVCPHTSVRNASLSAVHRGMRRSQRAQNGGPSGPRRDSAQFEGSNMLTDRALGGAASDRQRQKLRKKLTRKEREELPDDSGRQTRRKRFTDPSQNFGKTSLVYELKHGALKEEMSSFREERNKELKEFQMRPRQNQQSSQDKFGDSIRRLAHRDTGGRFGASKDSYQRSSRSSDEKSPRWPKREHSSTATRSDRPSYNDGAAGFDKADGRSGYDRSRTDKVGSYRGAREDRPNFDKADGRPSYDRGRNDKYRTNGDRSGGGGGGDRSDRGRSDRSRNNDDRSDGDRADKGRGRTPAAPTTTIRYTTAASQFLYGRSVVKAALDQRRRKLYNLYVQTGDNRNNDPTLTRLAERKNVPITLVPSDDQHVMDKVSMGRPHNGYILETSPLPQVPVKALGSLEESPDKLGFNIELNHQSKEEAEINGSDSFIARSGNMTAKPFVLLLHEIMDPGNLGALLRTASYLGVDAVGITSRSSATLTPVVLKSAAGAVEEITIFTVDSPVEFLEASKRSGWKAFSAVAPPEKKLVRRHGEKFISIDEVEESRPLDESPCILVLGNEGFGLPKAIKVATDYEISVPRFVQNSCVDSLNVSVAGGLLCHSFVRSSSNFQKSDADEEPTKRQQHPEEPEADPLF